MNPKPRFDKRNLWPWRWWMTIGVGVLATSDAGTMSGRVPDHIILMADTMGSYEDEYSHPRLHKTFVMPDINLYATAANQIDKAAELMPMIHYQISQFDIKARTFGDIVRAIQRACFMYKGECFTRTILPKYRISPDMFDPSKATPEINQILQPEWEKFELGCDLLIGSFTGGGQALLLIINGSDGTLQACNFPGFAAIGSGAGNAYFWLSHRKHTLGMTPERAAYHAYEAKLMAESAPNVNEHLDIVVANASEHWHSTTHGPKAKSKPHPTITAKELAKMYKRFCARSTQRLDQPKQSASQTAKLTQ